MKNQKPSLPTRIIRLTLALAILAGLLATAVQSADAASGASLSILSVQQDKSVTIQAASLPANTVFQVRMNTIGTHGANGTIAGTAKTNSSGSFKATFPIPASLKGQGTIAIRVETKNNPNVYAYNWFYNSTSGSKSSSKTSSTSSSKTTSTISSSSIPSGSYSAGKIAVTSVEEDESVSIQVSNTPANTTLAVWIDWKNHNDVYQGAQVGTVTTSQSGAANETFNLPSAARDRDELRIRLQAGSYLAYKWFLNADDDDGYSGSSASSGYTGSVPYFLVDEVVEDETVTIEVHNLAVGEYEVLMNEIGTKAKNGIQVDTVKIKKDATYTLTFAIPEDLADYDEIAIRLQNVDDSSYYTYTWFDNVTNSSS